MTTEEYKKYEEIFNDTVDLIYSIYESEISMQNVMYIHPMFYNGTFSKNNEYQPPVPEPLISKDEFIKNLEKNSHQDRWNTALTVLLHYKLKENE